MQRTAMLVLVAALAAPAMARFGRQLMSGNHEHVITFDGNLKIAQCGDALLFTTPTVQLLRDALCDPSAIERPEPESSYNGEILYSIPLKSVGRLVFADRDCMDKDAEFQEVQVVCEVHFADAVDSASEEPLTGDEYHTRGRQLIAFEHEVDWNNGGPYAPLEVTCGDSVSFAWKKLSDGKKESHEHSMWYLPDGECPTDYDSPNATVLQLHEPSLSGQYDLQLPLVGAFTLTIADGSMDGMACFTGHLIDIIVSCPWANSTDILFIPAPAPNQDKNLFDSSFFYLDDSLLGPAPGPDAETPTMAPARKAPAPAPAKSAPAPAPEGPSIPDYALEYLKDSEGPSEAPAPAPGPDVSLDFTEFEDPLAGVPKPKPEEVYNYEDFVNAPAPAPGADGREATYTYFYEETPTDGPNGTTIVKRIKRKSGEAATIIAAQPPIPETKTFPNITKSNEVQNAAAMSAGVSRVMLSVLLGAAALLALVL